MNKIKRLITNIKFWVWAATRSDSFRYFQIMLYPGIQISCGNGDYNNNGPYVHISFYKPKIIYDISEYAANQYAKICGIDANELYTLDDIPF